MSSEPEGTTIGQIAIKTGVSSVIAAAFLGLGALTYYGLGFSQEPGALEKLRTGNWSAETKQKIQQTFLYLLISFYICMVSAFFVHSYHFLFSTFTHPLMVLIDFIVQMIVQNGKLFTRYSDEGIFTFQKTLWILYTMFLGGIASPSFILGVQNAKISVHVTILIMMGLTFLALLAPVGKFVTWKKVLGMCEMIVFITSVGSALIPITKTAGAIFFAISFYGGLILYPICFLCHSQESHLLASDTESENSYCAIAASVPMLLDSLSTFGRIVVIGPPD